MTATTEHRSARQKIEHLDVLIVGAGISGIGCAYYLQKHHPQRSYAILEARERIGGTWDLFRYPGIRSDSDLHTFGFEFKPWRSEFAIADGSEILDYIHDAARENLIDRRIRTNQKVTAASWLTADARWTVTIEHPDSGETTEVTCNWLFAGTGYYHYDSGYTPELPGLADFQGTGCPPTALAGEPRLCRQTGGRDRQRRHGRHADPGDGGARRPHHDAAAIAQATSSRCRRRTRSRTWRTASSDPSAAMR